MDLLIDILLDAGKDTLSLVPFLLVTYLVLETLEHVAGDRVNGAIKRAGAAGPVRMWRFAVPCWEPLSIRRTLTARMTITAAVTSSTRWPRLA